MRRVGTARDREPTPRTPSQWRRALGLLALAAAAGVAILAARGLRVEPLARGASPREAGGACEPSVACALPSAASERATPRPFLPTVDPGRAVVALLTAVRQLEVAEARGALLDPAEPAALGALAREAGPALSSDPVATWPRKGPDRPEAIPLGALITTGAGDVNYGEKPEPELAGAPAVASARVP